jgi:hypothetical protein
MRLEVNQDYPGRDPSRLEGLGNNGPIYREIVRHYTARKMSEESDILNAIQGILSIISLNTGQEFLWGLPTFQAEM